MTKKKHDCPHCNKKSKESTDDVTDHIVDDVYDE
jgi:hypothetical protein